MSVDLSNHRFHPLIFPARFAVHSWFCRSLSPVVFAKLYFPGSDPLVGTLQAFAISAVGPHRPQGDADRNVAADRPLYLCRGLRAGLRLDRHLGCCHPDRAAFDPGYRLRRRMWCRAAVDGMGPDHRAPRLHRLMAAMGRPGRIVRRQPRGAGFQRKLVSGVVCGSCPSPQPSPREGPAPLGERARACRWAHLRCARGEPAPDPIRG